MKQQRKRLHIFTAILLQKKASKADFAQELSINLEKEYSDKDSNEIARVIPKYLIEAIKYVTNGAQYERDIK